MKLVIKKKNAFTLVELLIGLAIIAIMIAVTVATLNSIGIMNKGRDAQRKKDLNRIKIAFEEYFSDNGEYPTGTLLDELEDKSNCGTDIFTPYLNSWLCDPSGVPYFIDTDNSNNRFKVTTNLENKSDKDIPVDWYLGGQTVSGKTVEEVNYGVSSTNILWYEPISKQEYIGLGCDVTDCASSATGCNHIGPVPGCAGNNCYFLKIDGENCQSVCKTTKCPYSE